MKLQPGKIVQTREKTGSRPREGQPPGPETVPRHPPRARDL